MASIGDRPTLTPELYARFAAYFRVYPAWGSLHTVLDDSNLETVHVKAAVKWALSDGDVEGEALARILLTLTTSQRGRVASRVPRMVEPQLPVSHAVITSVD